LGLLDLSNSAMECPARPRRDHTALLALTWRDVEVTIAEISPKRQWVG